MAHPFFAKMHWDALVSGTVKVRRRPIERAFNGSLGGRVRRGQANGGCFSSSLRCPFAFRAPRGSFCAVCLVCFVCSLLTYCTLNLFVSPSNMWLLVCMAAHSDEQKGSSRKPGKEHHGGDEDGRSCHAYLPRPSPRHRHVLGGRILNCITASSGPSVATNEWGRLARRRESGAQAPVQTTLVTSDNFTQIELTLFSFLRIPKGCVCWRPKGGRVVSIYWGRFGERGKQNTRALPPCHTQEQSASGIIRSNMSLQYSIEPPLRQHMLRIFPI